MKIGPVNIPYHDEAKLAGIASNTPVPDIGTDIILGHTDPSGVPTFSINGILITDSTNSKLVKNQSEDILGLLRSNVEQNYSNTAEFDGYLSVRSVKVTPRTGRFTIRDVIIQGLAYPRANYLRTLVGNPKVLPNDFSFTLGSGGCDYYIPTPIGSTVTGGDGSTLTRTGTDGAMTLYLASTINQVNSDISTDQVNVGECKVYDSVTPGDTTEANWVLVTNKDHSFTGDVIFDNTLYRINIIPGSDYVTVYYYSGSAFTKLDDFKIDGVTFVASDIVVTQTGPEGLKLRLSRTYDIELPRGGVPYINTGADILECVTLTPSDQSTSGDNYLTLGTNLYICSNLDFSIVAASKHTGVGRKYIYYTTGSASEIAHLSMVVPNARGMLTGRL